MAYLVAATGLESPAHHLQPRTGCQPGFQRPAENLSRRKVLAATSRGSFPEFRSSMK